MNNTDKKIKNDEISKKDLVFLKKIRKKAAKTMIEYSMLEENDKVLIAFSGGKDSIVVSDIIINLKKKVNFNFELMAFMIGNENSPNIKFVKQQLESVNIKTIAFTAENIEKRKNSNHCHICSRIRRGTIYNYAVENNCNKIILGHHLDDVIETFFMNQFYQARLETMKAIFKSDDGRNTVIRPLHGILEKDIIKYFNIMKFEKLKMYCPFGTTKSKRSETKDLLSKLSDIEKYNIYHSIKHLYI